MRILCLNLKTSQENFWLDAFLSLSPRLQFRYPHYVFAEIESTQHLLGGERACLEKALAIAKKMNIDAQAAIADTPAMAQLLSTWKPSCIAVPGEGGKSLHGLGLEALRDLEGLEPWSKKKPVEHVIYFFQSLGIYKLEETLNFRLNSFRERWGDLGVSLWHRLHGQNQEVISPFIPRDPLVGYVHLDDPLSMQSLLLQALEAPLDILFLRLTGLGRFAQKMEVIFHCEYSDKKHVLEIEPVSPTRDQRLYVDLLSKKMEKLELENPIRQMEVSVLDVPEKTQQLDFFEPQDDSQDRWRRLISFAKQADCEMGFLQVEASHFPEKSFQLITEWPEDFNPQDLVERKEEALQVKSVYAKGLAQSPRPSLLLENPVPLDPQKVQEIRFMSAIPSERIESSWWQLAAKEIKYRDYYFALSQEGQLLWIFQDRINSQYYLHGYFD